MLYIELYNYIALTAYTILYSICIKIDTQVKHVNTDIKHQTMEFNQP